MASARAILRWWRLGLVCAGLLAGIALLATHQSPSERVASRFSDVRDRVVAGDPDACDLIAPAARRRVDGLVRPYASDCRAAVSAYGSEAGAIEAYTVAPRRVVVSEDRATATATTAVGTDGPVLTVEFERGDDGWLLSDFELPASIPLPR